MSSPDNQGKGAAIQSEGGAEQSCPKVQVSLMPFADFLKGERDEGGLPGDWLCLYPVLAHFANYATGEFWTSNKRIGAYAGMGTERVASIMEDMVADAWIEFTHTKGRVQYKKLTTLYREENECSANWYAVGRPIIHNGIWSDMPKTVKIVYSVMLANAMPGIYAFKYFAEFSLQAKDANWSILENDTVEKDKLKTRVGDCDFMKLSKANVISLMEKAAINGNDKPCARSIQRAFAWLQNRMLIIDSKEQRLLEGYLFPHDTPHIKEGFKEKIERMEATDEADAATKRSYNYWTKRARQMKDEQLSSGLMKQTTSDGEIQEDQSATSEELAQEISAPLQSNTTAATTCNEAMRQYHGCNTENNRNENDLQNSTQNEGVADGHGATQDNESSHSHIIEAAASGENKGGPNTLLPTEAIQMQAPVMPSQDEARQSAQLNLLALG